MRRAREPIIKRKLSLNSFSPKMIKMYRVEFSDTPTEAAKLRIMSGEAWIDIPEGVEYVETEFTIIIIIDSCVIQIYKNCDFILIKLNKNYAKDLKEHYQM